MGSSDKSSHSHDLGQPDVWLVEHFHEQDPNFPKISSAIEGCERILLGYTSVGIGLDLKIAQSSVVTYRRRAYEKLDISTQNELFTLCLTASQYQHGETTPGIDPRAS